MFRQLCTGVVAGVLVLSFTSGCSQPRQKRPVAGDTVSTRIVLGRPWKQGGLVLLSSRLAVQGPEGKEESLLQLEDIPYQAVPTATLTFFQGDKELEKWQDVKLTRDC